MDQPMAYLITWTTYGSWLPGDARGSFDVEGNYIPPNEELQANARALMTEDEVTLTPQQREIVEKIIEKHCAIRSWPLHARNARTNHVHVVVSASIDGEEVREQLKTWCSRALSEHAGLKPAKDKNGARRWWTEKGNVEPIWTDRHLDAAARYTNEQ
jgi:REP element-mobilizing transposase RayT